MAEARAQEARDPDKTKAAMTAGITDKTGVIQGGEKIRYGMSSIFTTP